MAKLNTNYNNLVESYLFQEIATRTNTFMRENPEKKVIRLGIGDVTEPLCPSVVAALKEASEEMGDKKTFKGYGDYEGYEFLRTAVANYYKNNIGVDIGADEIFVSDGAKSDTANFQELFDVDNEILIPDPVYPVYFDSNIMQGRKISLIKGTKENGFAPLPDDKTTGDIIYLCSPNNPTGAVYTREQLKIWVDFAIKNGSVILFDSAYEAFVSTTDLPRSIYEVEGARECAVEFCSLSKTACFTGTRCGYTVIPRDLKVGGKSLAKMWLRRQSTKFNGTSYIIQKGAAAVFTEQGLSEIKVALAKYKENASIMTAALDELGIWYTGGVNSPYVWLECGMPSWDFFDLLLTKANVVGTPGSGFGKAGEGFFRLTSFNTKENTIEAIDRIKNILKR